MNLPLLPVLGGVALLWAVLLRRTRRDWEIAPHLQPQPDEAPGDLPLVSVLLPARNEAGRMLAPCVRSLLAQDYPHFEILAVDDRSEDATGEALRWLAAEAEGRMTVLDGAPLPEGWVGKQHALMQAADRAQGQWLLTVDADALYDPTLVRDALRAARAQNADAFSLLPRVGAGDLWVSVTYPIGFWALLAASPLHRVNRADTTAAVAWGGFFLLRRTVFDAVGGYAPVCAETSEDTKLAVYLKRRGHRLRVAFAADRAYTPMYPTLRDLWHGTMKNVYCGPLLTPVIALVVAVTGILPAAVALTAPVHGSWGAAVLGAMGWALFSLTLRPVYRLHRIPGGRALLAPAGAAICVAQMLATTWRVAVTGRGIEWRGRRVRARRRPPHPHRLSALLRRLSPR